MKWLGHVECVRKKRKVFKRFIGYPSGKTSLEGCKGKGKAIPVTGCGDP
jgi:hypothetical protein